MRLSISDRRALSILSEVKSLKESSDREIMAWIIQRVVPRASANLMAFLDGVGPAILIDEHRRPAKKAAAAKKRKRR